MMKLYIILLSLFTWIAGFAIAQEPKIEEGVKDVNPEELKHPESPFLWKVEKEGVKKVSYLFGSIHMGDPRVLKLHPAAEKAFRSADHFYTEVDVSEAGALKGAMTMLRGDGTTLTKSLGPDLARKINFELKRIDPNLNSSTFDLFKTWMLVISIAQLEIQLENPVFLDSSLWERAKKEGKEMGTLETYKGLGSILDELTEKEQLEILEDTVDGMRKLRNEGIDLNQELLKMYLKADSEGLSELFTVDGAMSDLPEELLKKFFRLLLTERNKVMRDTIEKAMQNSGDKTHFFVAGVAHYIGPEHVVGMLQKKGYKVTRIEK